MFLRVGSKKTAFANFTEIAKMLHRQPKHLLAFLFAELGTSGAIDGSNQLIMKGDLPQYYHSLQQYRSPTQKLSNYLESTCIIKVQAKSKPPKEQLSKIASSVQGWAILGELQYNSKGLELQGIGRILRP